MGDGVADRPASSHADGARRWGTHQLKRLWQGVLGAEEESAKCLGRVPEEMASR